MTAVQVVFGPDVFRVELSDASFIDVPLERYPRLQYATESERQNWRLLGDGYAIEWPDIDEHIGIEGLVAGHKSGESQASLSRWLEQRTNHL